MVYGIGEIILVVAGILIAVQIGNINDDKKERIVQANYLNNLKEDLIADTLNLASIRTISQRNISFIENYEAFFNSGSWSLQEVVDSAFEFDLSFHLYYPNTTTFDEMKSAGDLRMLKPSIKSKLNEMKLLQNLLGLVTENMVKRADALKIEGLSFYYKDIISEDFNTLTGLTNAEPKLREALKYRHFSFRQFRDADRMVREHGKSISLISGDIINLIDEELKLLEKLK